MIDFMEVELNPGGASSDRFSPVATWDFVITRANAGEKLRALAGNIGEIQDLRPSRVGSSGRAIQMQIVGSRGSKLVNGYSFRNALVCAIRFSPSRAHKIRMGRSPDLFFMARLGHGIGLCQVGAFGMAQAGKSYEEILKTYYTDVEIKKAY